MLPPKVNLPSDKRGLIKLYDQLSDRDKAHLLTFAEFLVNRTEQDSEPVIHQPKSIPRPDDESVVGAIKRLSETYFMLDRSALFTETSSLMTAHIMQGRGAADVIDELEALFVTHYEQYLTNSGD